MPVDAPGITEESRRLRYTTYIGDGDSKGYHAVTAAQPYGADAQVVKEECIGHVQKRLGTALRNLKKEKKGQKLSDGKTIGGLGRLTDKLIDPLQTALRNGDSQQLNFLNLCSSLWNVMRSGKIVPSFCALLRCSL